MPYPLKKYTFAQYENLPPDAYEVMSPDKIYYMPMVKSAMWTISAYDIDNQQNTIFTLDDSLIETGYRVLMTTEVSGTVSGQQSHNVIFSGYDIFSNPYVIADNDFKDLPLGIVVSWTVFTQSYSAKIDLPYSEGGKVLGKYIKFQQFPTVLPAQDSIIYSEGEANTVYKNRIYIFNNEGEAILNQVFDPNTYEISGFLFRNEIELIESP